MTALQFAITMIGTPPNACDDPPNRGWRLPRQSRHREPTIKNPPKRAGSQKLGSGRSALFARAVPVLFGRSFERTLAEDHKPPLLQSPPPLIRLAGGDVPAPAGIASVLLASSSDD